MCRNIRTLFNFDPPVTPEEIRAASLQFVRKIRSFNKPSKANEIAFQSAVDEVAAAAARLVHSLETSAPPKRREEEAAKARARSLARFANENPPTEILSPSRAYPARVADRKRFRKSCADFSSGLRRERITSRLRCSGSASTILIARRFAPFSSRVSPTRAHK